MCSSVISSHSQVSTSGRRNSQPAYLPSHIHWKFLLAYLCHYQNQEFIPVFLSWNFQSKLFPLPVVETHMKIGPGESCSVRACAMAFQDLGWRVWFGRRLSRHRWRHGQARARPAPPRHQDPLPHAQGRDWPLDAYPETLILPPYPHLFRRSASGTGIVI